MPEATITTNEIMDFLREHMVTRKEFNVVLSRLDILESNVVEIKHDIKEINSRLDHIDREISAIKMRLSSLEKSSFEDSNAYASDIIFLKNKVASLEQQLSRLQAQVAR